MVTFVFERQPARRWHVQALPDVLSTLGTTRAGLTTVDAAERRGAFGANALPRSRPVPAWRILVAQLRSVIVLLLAAAIAVAAVTADAADAIAIGAVLVLNVMLGFAVEMRARRAVEALARLEPHRAIVVRDGLPREIAAADVVPGDIVVLDAGQTTPADARLVYANELRMDEAPLTGESVPVTKSVDARVADGATVADRLNMVFAGTTAVAGSAHAVVVATGGDTELGTIGRLVSDTPSERTPLEQRLDALGRQLVWVALGVGAATGVLAWAHDEPVAQVVEAAVALAVAAVPEGLPAVATITLALAVHRMACRRAIVRRLPCVETLGAVTVLCTDKTGTLTAGAMTVTSIRTSERTYEVSGGGYAPDGDFAVDGVVVPPDADPDLVVALRTATLVNRADAVLTDRGWVAHGDPTEAALVVAARKARIERAAVLANMPEVAEVPFSSERQIMATFHNGADRTIACLKGSPSAVLSRCDRRRVRGRDEWLDAEHRRELLDANVEMTRRGLRVLAVACGVVPRPEEDALAHLSFVALVGMTDPPAPHVDEAIDAFQRAGISTVMMTGDQRGTADAVARELGLNVAGASLDGHEIDRLSDAELRMRLANVAVISRASPAAKLRVVAAYQSDGHVVAMIGDGVNDAAALKRSDVGVTMGRRGTDVARETADVVLEDDRFETIGAAIEEGRIVFDNIRKFVFYLFSCNLAEILVLLGASAAGLPLPLAPVQVLWMNLVTDTVPALALATEPGSPDVMRRPPRRPQEALLSPAFIRTIVLHALLIAGSTFVVIAWAAVREVPAPAAMTMSFMALALAQVFHLGNARDEAHAVVAPGRMVANGAALAAVVIALAMQLLAVVSAPMATLLHVVPLSGREWAVVSAASLAPGVVGQVMKVWRSA